MEQIVVKIEEQNQCIRTAGLDPRCKLLLLIFLGLVSYFIMGEVTSLILIVGFGIFIAFGGGAKWAAKSILFYILVAYLNSLFRFITIPGISVMMSVFGVTVLKMTPIIMLGRWILDTTNIDDLMVSLQRMNMSQAVIIPLVVMFRYIPTLRIEYGMIKNTMKIRGICDTFLKRILHPVSTAEYILVPLLMRCLKVSDELAASGTTRGIECEQKRYSLRNISFSTKEYFTVIAGMLFLLSLIYLDHTEIAQLIIWRI
ncbi:MAG TPA: energy-coupling factor transporter transmembrane protein EcfT [Lachnospiraceae bacterium]|mgnify:CR=1 FL=1|nr:energy-coupling factor transporter transmembrane component T [uncultured Lachnoclostridium sp.]HAU87835.1 energy-coupling factor transporter transmembrane protein EcfT [Lachnospiraceae bacterium]